MRPLKFSIDFGGLDPEDNEFASIADFAEYLMDDDRESFDWRELNCLSYRLSRSNSLIRKDLESYGFALLERAKERRVRGVKSNSHDRWHGPGSCPTHGGSGWEQITGFAGQEG